MLRAAALFAFVILLTASMAWLTLAPEDECADLSTDMGAAVLADENGEQDALTNRAILKRGDCKPADAG
ncbi:MAG: hypothetical protein AB8C02_02110 [Halioglobus sp.]